MSTTVRIETTDRSTPPKDDITVKELIRFEDLEAINWSKLDPQNAPYITFIIANLKMSRTTPAAFMITKNGEFTAVAFGEYIHERIGWRLGYWNLPNSASRLIQFRGPWLIGCFESEVSARLIEAIEQALKRDSAAIVRFSQMNVNHPVYRSLKASSRQLSNDPIDELAVHWKLKLPPSFEEFYKSRTKNTKNNIRTYRNRARKKFGAKVRLMRHDGPHQIEEAIKIAESLTSKTYQRRLDVGFKDTAEQREWWHVAAKNGWLRFYVLLLDEEPAAFWAGTVEQGSFLVDFTSFDPCHNYLHPGQLALLDIIEELCHDPSVHSIDYGFGEAEYKKRFGSHYDLEAVRYYFGRSLRGQALRVARLLVSGSHQFITATLKRLNLHSRVRSAWRSATLKIGR